MIHAAPRERKVRQFNTIIPFSLTKVAVIIAKRLCIYVDLIFSIFELIYANNIESQHLIANIPIKYLYFIFATWLDSFDFTHSAILFGFSFIQIRRNRYF